MSIVRASELRAVPWKNGYGTTRELAVFPPTASMDTFVWRVSIADVTDAAPFSSFPGVDRTIVLLEGAGFTMTLDRMHAHALIVPFVPFSFSGEAQVDVALAGGATRDFNLMVRRGLAQGTVEVWDKAGDYLLDDSIVLLHAAQGELAVGNDVLRTGDTWLRDVDAAVPASLREGTAALAVRVDIAIRG